jgi:predicted DNA-binding ribbon-helix-helix protein
MSVFGKMDKSLPIKVVSAGQRIRRNVSLSGRRTSVSLEAAIWAALADICKREKILSIDLLSRVHDGHPNASFASSLRLFALAYYRTLAMAHPDYQKNGGQLGVENGRSVLDAALADLT